MSILLWHIVDSYYIIIQGMQPYMTYVAIFPTKRCLHLIYDCAAIQLHIPQSLISN